MQKLIDKFSNSRDFTISFALHVIVVIALGGTVLFKVMPEPPDFEGGSFMESGEVTAQPPSQPVQQPATTFNPATPPPSSSVNVINTTMPNALNFDMNVAIVPQTAPTQAPVQAVAPQPSQMRGDAMSAATAAGIKDFSSGWGKASGPGTSLRSREFEFTAFIGEYQGGDWNSTIRIVGKRIETGSLPNLLYLMSFWSKDKIKTNYKSVQAIKLDSDQLFTVKPPFIFLTGTKDFRLTDKEVENLQKYVKLGGCIWGDASLPGLRSRFDIAFRREMKRVIPDVDKDFEPLPPDHAIYTKTYFPEIREVPAGLNYYRDPVLAMKIYGEIAILYTSNDYSDMWQFGLNAQGEIDTRKGAHGNFIALNASMYNRRGFYVRNVEPPALALTYKFGTNVVIHLLTRWEDKIRTAPTL